MPGRKKTVILSAALAAVLILLAGAAYSGLISRETALLRIVDWETAKVYLERPVSPGDELRFGWIHSLENIPWNEYYQIDENLNLILCTISFTAFGAGIPHDMGNAVYIRDGVIYMTEINQSFHELVWINSSGTTQDILLAGELVTRGSELPHDRRLVLRVERRRNPFGR